MRRLWIILLPVLALISPLQADDDRFEPTLYRNKYGLFRLPKGHGDEIIVQAIKRGLVYESDTLDYISTHYEPGTIVVHAGAYCGDMLPFFSRLVGARGAVWAFEPVALHYECAVENIRLNKLRNVVLMRRALSDRNTTLWMHISDGRAPFAGRSYVVPLSWRPIEQLEEVEASTLDSLLQEVDGRISIIHLDIEGHECTALKGAVRTIARHKPMLILEVWPGKEGEIGAFVSKLGYVQAARRDGNVIYLPR